MYNLHSFQNQQIHTGNGVISRDIVCVTVVGNHEIGACLWQGHIWEAFRDINSTTGWYVDLSQSLKFVVEILEVATNG